MFTKRAERLTRSARTGARAGRWVALSVGLVTGIGVAAFAFFRLVEDPRFCARVAGVSGAHRTSVADVIAAASLPACRNVWLVNRRAVAARVEALPWVQSAEVDIVWPAGLRIRLTERTPAALVVFDGATGSPEPQAALIDATRRVLELQAYSTLRQPGLARLRVPSLPSGSVWVGQTLHDPAVTEALDAMARLRALGLDVTAVRIDSATGIGVTANRRLHVLIGEPTDFARKAGLFLAIAARIASPERVAYVDLRSVVAPTILYRNGGVHK